MLEETTRELVQWISVLPPLSLYTAFFLIAYVENVVPPIPGDVLVAFGGYLAAQQIIGIVPVYILTTIASVIGFMTMYAIGSYFGVRIQEEHDSVWFFSRIDLSYIERVREWMNRWGQGVILANRFLAGTRSVISITAGISHTKVSWTILNASISSLLWNGILLGLGWVLSENWRVVGTYLSNYSRIVLAGIALFVAVRLYLWYRERNDKRRK